MESDRSHGHHEHGENCRHDEETEAAEGPVEPTEFTGGETSLQDAIRAALKTCYDPEIPVDIYELGLIYTIAIDPENKVAVRMTLTSPMCPVAGSLPGEVQAKVREVPGVVDASVDLVWDPAWTPERMTPAAKLELGM